MEKDLYTIHKVYICVYNSSIYFKTFTLFIYIFRILYIYSTNKTFYHFITIVLFDPLMKAVCILYSIVYILCQHFNDLLIKLMLISHVLNNFLKICQFFKDVNF